MEVNVMTYNIHHGKGTDRKLDLKRIAEVIRQSSADVICLNEVDRYFSKRSMHILDFVQNDPLPTIAMGDWNMNPGSKTWMAVTENMQDSWAMSGGSSGHTYPSYRPRRRLDYVFISENIKVIETKVIDMAPVASDHLPVLATLCLS